MVNPGQELSSIDFESMLGGPLIAVVNAQAQAALSSVNFIKSVGFKAGTSGDPEEQNTGDPIYVTFKYSKEIAPYQPAVLAVPAEGDNPAVPASDAVPAKFQDMKLEVPILTMLPIPFIRIDETTIDFNAKINTMEYKKVDTSFKIDASLEAKARWGWGSAKLKVSTSYQRNTQQGSKVDRTYSMNVHIKAVQDEMPAGMEKVLGILEDAMRSEPLPVE
ncbi:MAG: DUF2589 domain-containing protein [Methanosarcinaceae archaeon]